VKFDGGEEIPYDGLGSLSTISVPALDLLRGPCGEREHRRDATVRTLNDRFSPLAVAFTSREPVGLEYSTVL